MMRCCSAAASTYLTIRDTDKEYGHKNNQMKSAAWTSSDFRVIKTLGKSRREN